MKTLHAFRSNSFRDGFTLIELLVVISIMAILMGLAAVSYSTAQVKSRDAKRRGDIQSVQKAFEQYFATNTTYDADTTCDNIGEGSTNPSLPGDKPTDPKNVAPNVYTFACTTSTYCVCSRLETTGAGNSTNASCSYGSGNFFCVSNQQ